MDKDGVLQAIFDDDPLGLLKVKLKTNVNSTADERLLSSFEEINAFIDKVGRVPEANMADIAEFQLATRLNSLQSDLEKINLLKRYDRYHILLGAIDEVGESQAEYSKPKEINSMDDLLSDDSLGLLGSDDAGLFDFKHTQKAEERESADFVARRKPCRNFEKYVELFKQVQEDLNSGKRKLVDFQQSSLEEGAFYVHNGVLFLLESIILTQKEHYKADGTRVREDGRTRCVFENGTESNMLKRSVEKILYANGKVVTHKEEDINQDFSKHFNAVNENDSSTGFIYVLKSLSEKDEIASIDNLFKIGFSTTAVEERIKNAEKEPTYLMAPVQIVCTWECYNMNAHKFEQLIHNFFGNHCLEVDVFDTKGQRHTPREWFIVPLSAIEKAVELIMSGEVGDWCFDGSVVIKK